MFIETITHLLELSPSGLSNDQLLWRLRRSGVRLSAEDILETLVRLSDSGIAVMSSTGRWRLAKFDRPSVGQAADTPPPHPPLAQGITLRAIPGTATHFTTDRGADLSQSETTPAIAPGADADWRKMLAYYEATQRLDPRGAVEEREDRHGLSWQLFQAGGNWWDAGQIRFSSAVLPPSFREALTRRPGNTCSIGYPLGLFDETGVASFVPALLLPATFKFDGSYFVVDLTAPEPVLNPRWLEPALRRVKGWQKERLIDALFPEGEERAFEVVVMRLANTVATLGGNLLRPAQLTNEMTVQGEGLRNVAGLFLPSDSRFTQGAERDLEAMQSWSDVDLGRTSLAPLLCPDQMLLRRLEGAGQSEAAAPVGPQVLTERQYDAAVSALDGPLTLVQGPPGTGKSEVILTLLASVVFAGRSALLVSKNHRALDEVEERLVRIVGKSPLLTRARDVDGERDTSFLEQMQLLASGDARPGHATNSANSKAILGKALRLRDSYRHRSHVTKLNLELSETVERLERWEEAKRRVVVATHKLSILSRIANFLRRLTTKGMSASGEELASIAKRVEELRRELAAEIHHPEAADLDALADSLATEAAAALGPSAIHITVPAEAGRQELIDAHQAFRFSGRTRASQMTANEVAQVIQHRPIWAVSTLSAASRVPLHPGLFDYVIFDEASQCDIASALPLFARARKAVVVGDPEQLAFIPQLSIRQEHALMDAAGLGRARRHSIAQSVNSLFKFVAARGSAQWHFLADQFRSDPAIVDYLNAEFYNGQLIAAQDGRKARWPDGYKPGLAWHDVKGRPAREEGGNVNHAEADEVVRLLVGMIREHRFAGSVGILSPFNTQVALLLRRINATLTESERREVRVATIDRFQGGEADVVIFSVVVGPGVHPGALSFYERERRRLNVAISRARALCLVVGDREFARTCRVRTLAYLADNTARPPRPRDPFDSEWERRLDAALRRRGLNPLPQYPVGSRYLDFALDPDGQKLDVEVDGRRWHADPDGNRKMADRLRDRELIGRGWRVRRFWVHELAEDMEKCVDLVERDLGHA